jgi:hypothetical protein
MAAAAARRILLRHGLPGRFNTAPRQFALPVPGGVTHMATITTARDIWRNAMRNRFFACVFGAAGIVTMGAPAVLGADIVTRPVTSNTTTLTDPVTSDTVTLLTHAEGTYVIHANGLAGYIAPRPKDAVPPKDPAAQHAYFVSVYEAQGYVKAK